MEDTKTPTRNQRDVRRHFSATLTLAFIALASVASVAALSAPLSVAAMGDNPTTCPNMYGSTITSMIVYSQGGSANPLVQPGVNISEPISMSYNVTFVLHTDKASLSGNTAAGTTWFSEDIYGYENGVCVNMQGAYFSDGQAKNVGPNQNVRVSELVSYDEHAVDHDSFYTFTSVNGTQQIAGAQPTYNVLWETSQGTQTSLLTVRTENTAGQTITGYYTGLYYYEGSSGTGSSESTSATAMTTNTSVAASGFSPVAFVVGSGQTYTLEVDNFGACTFAHWADTGSTNRVRVLSVSIDTELTAVYSCTASVINLSTITSTGGKLSGYYATLSVPGGAPMASCFSPCSLTVEEGQTYLLTVANYGAAMFTHWSDNNGITNSWGGSRMVTVPDGGNSNTTTSGTQTIAVTAVYNDP